MYEKRYRSTVKEPLGQMVFMIRLLVNVSKKNIVDVFKTAFFSRTTTNPYNQGKAITYVSRITKIIQRN